MSANEHLVTSIEQLEALYGEQNAGQVKEIDHISRDYRKLIEAAPFVAIATGGPKASTARRKATRRASCACSTKRRWRSGPAGQQPHRRLSQHLAATRALALLFLIPGVGETLRVNGRASISIDPELMQSFAVQRQAAAQRADRSRRDRRSSIARKRSCARSCGTSHPRSTARACRRPAASSPNQPRQTRRRDLRPRAAGADQGAMLFALTCSPHA